MNDYSINSVTINGYENISIQRAISSITSRAVIIINGTVQRKNIFKSLAIASDSVVNGRVKTSNIIFAVCEAYSSVTARIIPQVVQRLVVDMVSQTSISLVGRVIRRLQTKPIAESANMYLPRVYRKSITIQVAEAFILNEVSIFREIPWDEPAAEDRTFIVPKGIHVFYVRA